jgi:outer membrane protein assembly factor BamB
VFHVKQQRLLGFLIGLGLLGLLVLGCSTAGSRGWAPPVQDDGVTYVTTGAGRLDAIDSGGTRLWRFPQLWEIPERGARDLDGIYGRPILSNDGNVLFLGDYNGHLYAFRPADLDLDAEARPRAASLKLNGPVIGGLALDSAADSIYVTSADRVYSVRASDMVNRIGNRDAPVTRAILLETGGEIWATPVVADGKVLIASLDGTLYAVDGRTGSIVWRFDTGKGLVSTPVVVGDRVLVGGFDSTLFAVDLNSGREAWSFKASNWLWARPAVANGVAYFGDFSGELYAVNVSTGNLEWSVRLNQGALRAGPTVAGNNVIVGTDSGWLIGINTATQQRAWAQDLGTALRADLVTQGNRVLLAPDKCVTPAAGSEKTYYTSVDPSNGELTRAGGVC